MTDKAQQIVETIERAFAGVQLEEGISLGEAIVLDDYGSDEDRALARSHDELHDWRNISDETIACSSVGLSFLDAKGIRFYLPAFMRFALRHYQHSDSASISYIIYTLDCSSGSGAPLVDDLLEKATDEQRALLTRAFSAMEIKEKFESARLERSRELALLTEAQWDAVRLFLEFMAFDEGGHGDARVARQALEAIGPLCSGPGLEGE